MVGETLPFRVVLSLPPRQNGRACRRSDQQSVADDLQPTLNTRYTVVVGRP